MFKMSFKFPTYSVERMSGTDTTVNRSFWVTRELSGTRYVVRLQGLPKERKYSLPQIVMTFSFSACPKITPYEPNYLRAQYFLSTNQLILMTDFMAHKFFAEHLHFTSYQWQINSTISYVLKFSLFWYKSQLVFSVFVDLLNWIPIFDIWLQ